MGEEILAAYLLHWDDDDRLTDAIRRYEVWVEVNRAMRQIQEEKQL